MNKFSSLLTSCSPDKPSNSNSSQYSIILFKTSITSHPSPGAVDVPNNVLKSFHTKVMSTNLMPRRNSMIRALLTDFDDSKIFKSSWESLVKKHIVKRFIF